MARTRSSSATCGHKNHRGRGRDTWKGQRQNGGRVTAAEAKNQTPFGGGPVFSAFSPIGISFNPRGAPHNRVDTRLCRTPDWPNRCKRHLLVVDLGSLCTPSNPLDAGSPTKSCNHALSRCASPALVSRVAASVGRWRDARHFVRLHCSAIAQRRDECTERWRQPHRRSHNHRRHLQHQLVLR